MLRHGFVSALVRVIAGLVLSASAWSATPLLLRNPSLSQDRIAFFTPVTFGPSPAKAAKHGV